MDLLIKNFDKLDEATQQEIKEYVDGALIPEFILMDQIGSLNKWINEVKLREDFIPSHIDLSKIYDLLEKGEIKDPKLVMDPEQKTLMGILN